MNKAESAQIENLLVSRGWEKSESPQTADMVVINTCSVRETAESRVLGRLGWYTSLKAVRNKDKNAKPLAFPRAALYTQDGAKPLTLVLTGCMAERFLAKGGGAFKKAHPEIDYTVGTFQKRQFSHIARAVEQSAFYTLSHEDRFEFLNGMDEYSSHQKGDASAFVPIMHGCNNFCAYCIVPYVRGREVSRPAQSILGELDELSGEGVKEITLLGQNVNSYRYAQFDFPALVNVILEHLEKTNSSVRWVRFLSSHPKDLSPRLIDVITDSHGQERRMCRHIHLPVQHGSNSVLCAMNRQYTREDYLELTRQVREKIPNSSLSTDILIGFPGETEDDVEQTISLMKEARFEAAFTYYYNPREGTPAALLPQQIPLEVKKERLTRVINVSLEIVRAEMAKRVGQTVPALVEGVSRNAAHEYAARTEQDGHVVFSSPEKNPIGDFVTVKLTELTGNTFRGIIQNEAGRS